MPEIKLFDQLLIISIIIPCYNDAQYIEQSVMSALNQTYSNIEVIVVDDGSNIETKRVLEKLKPKITKLITQENKGQSTARNVGILESKGDLVLVLDSDDFFEPTFCEKAISALTEDTTISLVTCYSNILINSSVKSIYKPSGGLLKDFLISNGAMGSSLFKKKDWDEVFGYDQLMRKGFEDWEFYIRILSKGGRAKVIPEPLFNYTRRKESTTTKANKIKYKLLQYIYTKHRELYIAHFDMLTTHLLFSLEREEKEKLKILSRIEYRIGFNLLKPFRYLKRIYKIIINY